MPKLKRTDTAGVTLSMKNCFGITPCTIYGDGAPKDEAGRFPYGGRGPFHFGNRTPPKSAPQPIHLNGSKDPGYRVPRVVADLVAAVAALAALPPRRREVLVLRYYLDLPEAQIAATMGISKGAVKSHTARAIASLRAVLEQAS